ncbi:hypothetical protein BAG01nite_46060 [Brevibacillus agri]|uniref:Uncharacterized protein n=1 Tax=Brevibacillus agri TaxID=51101 RepID=A0ABQ0SXA5_9BACL|nr:hypothetical protein BAG01nite_46060 [Brevibacillus agri]
MSFWYEKTINFTDVDASNRMVNVAQWSNATQQNRHHGGGQDEKTILPSASGAAGPAAYPRLGGCGK